MNTKHKISILVLALLLAAAGLLAIQGWTKYKRLSSRIEDKYVVHLIRNARLLEQELKEEDIHLGAFVESLNAIEMLMDPLSRDTLQSKADINLIDDMWRFNSSVMQPLTLRDNPDNYPSDEEVIMDLEELSSFYIEHTKDNEV